jgi:hypothetical protein
VSGARERKERETRETPQERHIRETDLRRQAGGTPIPPHLDARDV